MGDNGHIVASKSATEKAMHLKGFQSLTCCKFHLGQFRAFYMTIRTCQIVTKFIPIC